MDTAKDELQCGDYRYRYGADGSIDGRALYSQDGRRLHRLVVPCASFAIPEGCTDVDDRACDSIAALREVSFPSSLRSIGRLAFAKTGLVSVRIPASVERLGDRAFYHCRQLTEVTLLPGLRHIGVEAFALSALRRLDLPATLEHVGPRALDRTPAQRHAGVGAITVSPENVHLHFDGLAGLYRDDVLVELIGQVEDYCVRSGTRAIGPGACKRHATVRAVHLPEGVVSIGREAFRGNRQLRCVDLPDSLEHIGNRAFLDTSIETLRLSANVCAIGENALLVQGENQLTPRVPLRSVALDARNPAFYVEGGLLCQRGGNARGGNAGGNAGGDICILYVGPDNIVRIPDQVTQMASLAFCGADGIDELHVHSHMHSFCLGALSTARSISRIHVDFPVPIDGYSSGDFLVPKLSIRFRSPAYLLDADARGTVFNFEYYDSWVAHTADMGEFAPAALYRLQRPMRLSSRARDLYQGTLRRKGAQVCRLFAARGDMDSLESLCAMGLLDEGVVHAELESSLTEGRTQATACLLELEHRTNQRVGIDYGL